ncbi:MAG: hypothetical protein KAX44_09270, partial [Candidatus Brocadiae bacterium]|nr:hypothetical protein [Candidatus Brocadiia bacterium]
YHMVCGQVPYTGTTFEVMTKQVREPLPSPKIHVEALPDDLCDIIRKMMAKDPANRYDSYEALRDDLTNLLEGKAVTAAGFRDQSMVTAELGLGANAAQQAMNLAMDKTQLANPPSRRRNTPILIAIIIVAAAFVIALIAMMLMP